MTISEILGKLSAELVQGDLDTTVLGFASLADAKHGDLSFFGDPRYASALEHTLASVILVPLGWQKMPLNAVCIAVADPSSAFNLLVAGADRETSEFSFGIHPTAVVPDDVLMDPTRVHIGAKAVVESGAKIGDGSVIGPGCFVGRNVVMGEGCRLYPNVTIYDRCILGNRVAIHSGAVIGADGFGYRTEKGTHLKVAQNGIVQIDDDVEIGANTTIDRARIGKTWIGEGTKIDNLVQIGHNVVIGKHCMMISQSGIAGSTSLGDHVVIAAQAGIVGHVSVGSRNIIGARAVVTKSLPDDGGVYLGFPAVPAMQERRRMVASKGVQGFSDRLKKMENQMRQPAGGGE